MRTPTFVVVAIVLVLVQVVIIATGGSLGCEPASAGVVAGPNAVEVLIKTEPAGGTIIVDGAPVGPSPQTVKLNPGPHRLRASMSGYYPAPETRIQVGASEPREHTITLVASH